MKTEDIQKLHDAGLFTGGKRRKILRSVPRRAFTLIELLVVIVIFAILAGCSDNQNAQQPSQNPKGVQSHYRNGHLEIVALFSFVPLDSQTLERAVTELRKEETFAWGLGLHSGPSDETSGERALSVILDSSNALTYFEAVLTNATPAGQLYALCGIHKLSPPRFATLAAPLAMTNLTVGTSFGCLYFSGGSVASNVAQIAAGEYDKRIEARPWRWTSNGSSNGVWKFAPLADPPDAKVSP